MPGPTSTAACVLYEMLAGELHIPGPPRRRSIAKRLTEPVPSVRRCARVCRKQWSTQLSKALAPVAADRFASAAEFARALQPGRHGDAPTVPLVPARAAAVSHARSAPATVAGGGYRSGARLPHRPRRAVRLAAESSRGADETGGARCWPSSRSRIWVTRPRPTSPTGWAMRSAASCPSSRVSPSLPAPARTSTGTRARRRNRSHASWGPSTC